jgi:signal transduction histidine kinase
MVFGDNVTPWTRHVQARRDLVRRAFDAANEIGDLTYAAYCCNHLITNLLAAGDQLVEVQREAENGLEFARKIRFGLVICQVTAQLGLIRTLRGLTPKFGSFNDEEFDELQFERDLASNPAVAEVECWYSIRKLQARFFAGDYASAVDASSRAQRVLWTSPSQFETAEFHFYGALSHAASWDSAGPDQRQQHFEALTVHHRQLQVWAENCPENFENRAVLVGAEIARMQGRELEAERLYEQAIRSARANGFVHNEALANEVAARFYMARGFDKIARTYLRDARYCYLRWGADGKVRQLDELYPHLGHEKPLPDPTSTIVAPIEQLDVATIIKVSQAVSGEIDLEGLIDTLMRKAIQQAGAERGLLILPRGDELRIEAEATASGETIIVGLRRASVAASALPELIVNYVVRTQEIVILDDASAQNPFSADAYIREHHVRSVLCLPLLKQGKLTGVLYLENNLTPHVFTPVRMVVLKLLASEAAISLENTRLYSELKEREQNLRESERRYHDAQMALAHANRVATMGQLSASIAHEISQPIGSAITNATAALHFLRANPPDVEEVRDALGAIVRNIARAGEVIDRIRALIKKAPPEKDRLEVNETVLEVLALTRGEMEKNYVSVQTQLAEDLPAIQGDRVQVQQVILNLFINAVEAMNEMNEGRRELLISTAKTHPAGVLVTVRDSGPGFSPERAEHLFDAFYTTKSNGLGLGLSICRSIIEAHSGRLWATANTPQGAVFQFTLPMYSHVGNEES